MNRLHARLEDINSTIALLRVGDKGENAEKILEALAKKEVLEPKVWDAEDALEVLTEDDKVLNTGELIVMGDEQMKKLFNLLVIDDGGLAAFMENEEIGYMAMTQYIQSKISEERGNV